MPLGAKARGVLKREEKRGTDRAKREREELLAYEYRLNAVRRKLREGKPVNSLPPVVISTHANDRGFVTRVQQGKHTQRVVQVIPSGTGWGNGLEGLIAGLEKVQPRSEVVIVHCDPVLAAKLCPETMAQYEKESRIDPKTSVQRPHVEKWQRLKQLLDAHHYVAVSDKEINSPVMKMCRKELKEQGC